MLAGKIKVDIEFGTKELQRNEEAELIFDYIDEHNFKCVGITGNAYKYEVKSCINGTWQYLRTIGKEVILLCERDKRAGLPFDIYKNLAFIICFNIYNGKVSTSA